MKVFLGADHRGFAVKEKIKEWLVDSNYEVVDMGNNILDPNDDYPDFSLPVAREVSKGNGVGVLFCGSGAGMDMIANKIKGVRSALVFDEARAKQAREHEDANILTLPTDVLDNRKAIKIVKIFLETPFSNKERHIRRIEKIKAIENSKL